MKILGIDPGSRRTGYGVIEVNGDRSMLIASGVVKAGTGEFTERLGIIFSELKALIGAHAPDEVAIESVFVSHNASSALKLGQARGAAICAAIDSGLPVSEYAPRAIKQAMVGKGSADKRQVQHMVRILLNHQEPLAEDAADALAVALCHQHTHQTLARLKGS
ncbi:MAG: crossover junction endodeoxyribonuclease RuvC [Xanthomonadales bacterium]|nr:crossover junction endodeoxyribonuclease RuvC [Xanthomonadales bacterium]